MFSDNIKYNTIKMMLGTKKEWLPRTINEVKHAEAIGYYTPSNANWSYHVYEAETNDKAMYLLTQFGQIVGCRTVCAQPTEKVEYFVEKDGKIWGGRKFSGRDKAMTLWEATKVQEKHGGTIIANTLDEDGWVYISRVVTL